MTKTHHQVVVEDQYEFNLVVDIKTKLTKDYFEEINDQTADIYIHYTYLSRKYNIHTGLLSEYTHEFNNHENAHYEIEIVNPDDSSASITIIIPVISVLLMGYIFKRKRSYLKT